MNCSDPSFKFGPEESGDARVVGPDCLDKVDVAFLKNIICTMTHGLVITDRAGIVQIYNPACEALFGYRADEVIGQDVSILFAEQESGSDESHLAQYLGKGAEIGGVRDIWGRRKDGATFPLEVSVSRFKNNGKVIFSAVVSDVSERHRIHKEREKLIEKLTESNSEFERFAYVASHDMQEPLRAMSSFSDILVTDYRERLDDDGKLYLKLIRDAATRMQTMVVDLLEYARLGKEPAPITAFSAHEELTHMLENMALQLVSKKTEIVSDHLPEMRGNAVQFSRLMQNLIGNSLKYCRTDIAPAIAVRVQDQGNHWQFAVSDNGIGIDEKDMARIFEPFQRLHSRQKYTGTGLGLSVCKKIVESHGGRIWCESKLDQGATFFFTWPK
jgi:two-component system sensor kinase FixL